MCVTKASSSRDEVTPTPRWYQPDPALAPVPPVGEPFERHPAALEAWRPDVGQWPPDWHDPDRDELLGDPEIRPERIDVRADEAAAQPLVHRGQHDVLHRRPDVDPPE